MIAIVAYYADQQYHTQTRLLVFRRLHGEHNNKNQAKFFIKVLKDYGIAENLSYFVTDNAKNYNAAVNLTLQAFLLSLTTIQRQQRRLRYWGYILNFAVNTFLFGKEPENFGENASIFTNLTREQLELQH